MTERPDNLVERIDAAVLLISAEGQVRFTNAAASRLFGRDLTGADLARDPFIDDTPLTSSVAHAFRRRGARGEVLPEETGGAIRYHWLTSSDDGDGKMLVLFDVTEALGTSSALGRVLSQVSHDLRGPLTSVAGAAELLLSGRTGAMTDAHRRMVVIIDDGAKRMNEIIAKARSQFPLDAEQAGEDAS